MVRVLLITVLALASVQLVLSGRLVKDLREWIPASIQKVKVPGGEVAHYAQGAAVGLQVDGLPVKEALSALVEDVQENSIGHPGAVRIPTEQGDVRKLKDKVSKLWKMAQKENVEPLAVITFLAYMDNLQKKSALALTVFGELEHKILSHL